MSSERRLISLADYERQAASIIDPAVWDWIQGGSDDEITLRANREAFARAVLRPRALAPLDGCDLATTALGDALALPVMVAPTALHRLVHREGELATASAAAAAGTVFVVSSMSSVAVEELAQIGGKLWFQLYVFRDHELTAQLVQRAESAGCRALVVTVDARRLGRRERDLRNGFALPKHIRFAHIPAVGVDVSMPGHSALEAHARDELDRSVNWETIAWLRSLTRMPIVLKGILTCEDAERACAVGARGIIVSNHGGRQLDGVAATIDALPEVVAAAGSCEVFLDGGVRRGSDVLKAGALGARAVLIGRPPLWGLAVAGAAGVRGVIQQLRDELESCMALSGYGRWKDVGRTLVSWSRQPEMSRNTPVGLASVGVAARADERAPALAIGAEAISNALSPLAFTPQDVDYLLCVAPATLLSSMLSARLSKRMGLRTNVQRIDIAATGCNAVFNGMQAVVNACVRKRDSVGIVLCIDFELTNGESSQQPPAGATLPSRHAAAAAVMTARAFEGRFPTIELVGFESYFLAEQLDVTCESDGVPAVACETDIMRISSEVDKTIERFLQRYDLERRDIARWRVHSRRRVFAESICSALDLRAAGDGSFVSDGSFVGLLRSHQRLLREEGVRPSDLVVMIGVEGPTIDAYLGRFTSNDRIAEEASR
jgi:4-hydroxymandelate oxidase